MRYNSRKVSYNLELLFTMRVRLAFWSGPNRPSTCAVYQNYGQYSSTKNLSFAHD